MDSTRAMARHDRKRDKLGQYAECSASDCAENDIRCLRNAKVTGPDGVTVEVVLCASCHVQWLGKRATEDHHLSGQSNDAFTISIPANEHAVLSDAQQDWPGGTLRNLDGSPLLAAAAAFRGWLDILRLMIDRTIGWIPPYLESLDSWLRTTAGNQWWTSFEQHRMETT
jgi:hypothetical protein